MSRDWNETKNNLTWELFKQGYTKDNHPDYVMWDETHFEFEYTREFIYNSVWEAPCSVIRKGEATGGYLCYGGIYWRIENNNYNFPCPYRKKECEFFHTLLKDVSMVGKCAWHLSDKQYDYNNSAEKIEDEREELIRKNLDKKFGTNGMISCACCHVNQDTCEPYFKYNPFDCMHYTKNGCRNEICWCTGKKRDLTLANIYYDVKTTEEFRHGFIVEPDVKVIKGKKLFDTKKAMTDLEMYLKMYPDAVYEKEKSRHHSKLFFAEYHGKKFELKVLNICIEKRESRDLLQDLEDIKEGIEVIHESDRIKKNKESKKERRQKYQEDKLKRAKKKQFKKYEEIIKTGLYEDIDGNIGHCSPDMLEFFKERLEVNGVEIREQIGINDLIGDD